MARPPGASGSESDREPAAPLKNRTRFHCPCLWMTDSGVAGSTSPHQNLRSEAQVDSGSGCTLRLPRLGAPPRIARSFAWARVRCPARLAPRLETFRSSHRIAPPRSGDRSLSGLRSPAATRDRSWRLVGGITSSITGAARARASPPKATLMRALAISTLTLTSLTSRSPRSTDCPVHCGCSLRAMAA